MMMRSPRTGPRSLQSASTIAIVSPDGQTTGAPNWFDGV